MVKPTRAFVSNGMLMLAAFYSISATAKGEIEFGGSLLPVITVSPDAKSGLDAIYVIDGLSGVTLSYESQYDLPVYFSTFDNLGIAFAKPVDNVRKEKNIYTVDLQNKDCGYIINDGTDVHRIWIIDYRKNPLEINTIFHINNNDCDATEIGVDGNGTALVYYTINGRKEVLSRDIEIVYNTLQWNEENKQYNQVEIRKNIPSFSDKIIITPPVYCNTVFRISGDRFLTEWGHPISAVSDQYQVYAVNVTAEAIQDMNKTIDEDSSNVIDSGAYNLGGSAPADIVFKGYATDAVEHKEWQFSTDEEFENISYRFYDQDISYSFTQEGKTYVRFIGSNGNGFCQSVSQTYVVEIGTSYLKIPNVFTPNGDGINDIWKVSYRSLTYFNCRIFNRQGHEVFRFSDPDKGWDGKRDGKIIKPGVYFYIIQATGSDGIHYNKSGDINIIYGSDIY